MCKGSALEGDACLVFLPVDGKLFVNLSFDGLGGHSLYKSKAKSSTKRSLPRKAVRQETTIACPSSVATMESVSSWL